jgi:hypothetical protein
MPTIFHVDVSPVRREREREREAITYSALINK